MSLSSVKSRLKTIEDKVFFIDKDKWRLNVVSIYHRGTDEDINNNKKYYFKYQDTEYVYDDIQDFYKEHNIYPKKDINPIIIDIVDNSHLEKSLYLEG